MALKKFTIPPQEAGYTVTDGEETIAEKLDGGASRYRADILNASLKVTVRWLFTQAQFGYFRAFYKGTTASGSLPFLLDLIIDEGTALTEHTCNFVPRKLKTIKVKGHSYQVSVELEVRPIIHPDGFYDSIVFLYEQFGEDQAGASNMFNQLEQLVTVDLPNTPVFAP